MTPIVQVIRSPFVQILTLLLVAATVVALAVAPAFRQPPQVIVTVPITLATTATPAAAPVGVLHYYDWPGHGGYWCGPYSRCW